jgi:catechol 2,3-dioxygenase-like lactoylglutathione lyase family enzyme
MQGKLWNLGMKVKDVEAEAAYFVALGGTLLAREKLTTAAGEVDYALLEFGGTRLFLTPKTIFEERLEEPLHTGLTHAVFEVGNFEAEVERVKAQNSEELLPPTEIEGAFGRRRIAFFRSPGGLVFEVMQALPASGVA